MRLEGAKYSCISEGVALLQLTREAKGVDENCVQGRSRSPNLPTEPLAGCNRGATCTFRHQHAVGCTIALLVCSTVSHSKERDRESNVTACTFNENAVYCRLHTECPRQFQPPKIVCSPLHWIQIYLSPSYENTFHPRTIETEVRTIPEQWIKGATSIIIPLACTPTNP